MSIGLQLEIGLMIFGLIVVGTYAVIAMRFMWIFMKVLKHPQNHEMLEELIRQLKEKGVIPE